MADSVQLERLIVSLEASTVKYTRALEKANAQTNQSMKKIEKRTQQAAAAVGDSFKKAYFAIGGIAAVRAAQDLIDTSVKIQNSLKIAGLAGDDLRKVYDQLFASAQRNAAPVEALATLYGRVAQVQNELGIGTQELVKFTDNIAVALRVSGRSAQEAQGALLQLGQALGGTVVHAEEFNSINENALPILQATAKGLVEAGGSVAKLRALVIDGKVSSKAFFEAFQAGAVELQDKVGSAELTISQGFVRFQNVLIDVAGQFNENTAVAKTFNDGLENLADVTQSLADTLAGMIPPLQLFFGTISNGLADFNQWLYGMGKLAGLNVAGAKFAANLNSGAAMMGVPPSAFQAQITGGGALVNTFTNSKGVTVPIEFLPQDPESAAALDIILGRKPGTTGTAGSGIAPQGPQGRGHGGSSAVKPVSLKDFPIVGDDSAKKTKKDPAKEVIADLEHELKLIGQTELAQQKLNNVRKAGENVTAEQTKQIEALTEQLYHEQEAVEYLQDLYDELGNIAKSAITDIIGALEDGKISAEEFGGILSNVLSMAANFFLNQAFGNSSNGFSALLTGLFGGGRAMGGPVEAGKIYKVNENTPNSEYFAPTQDGVIIPRLPTGSQGAQSSSNVFHIDARGAQRGVGEEIRRALEDYDRYKLPNRVNQIKRDPLARG